MLTKHNNPLFAQRLSFKIRMSPFKQPPEKEVRKRHCKMIRVAMNDRIDSIRHGWGSNLCCISQSSLRYRSNRVAGYHRQEMRILAAASTDVNFTTQLLRPGTSRVTQFFQSFPSKTKNLARRSLRRGQKGALSRGSVRRSAALPALSTGSSLRIFLSTTS